MTRDEIKKIIKLQDPDFLPKARHKGYVCPVCRNGSGRDGDGIVRTPGSEYFHCFKCGLHADVFMLVGESFSLPEFKDQYRKACELYGLDSGELKKPTAPPTPYTPEPEEEEEPVDHTENFKEWNEALNNGDNLGLAYMQARGLSLDTLNRFNVGFASNWKHPKTEHISKVPSSPRVIIPTSPSSYLARDPRDPENVSESARKYMKSKVGRAHLFNAEALMTAEDIVFLVEGEIDAMSLAEIGVPAVGLGSASNKRKLVSLVEEHKPAATLVILPDNDEAGKKAAAEITEEMKAFGVKTMIANIFGDCKDANELLVKDRKLLEARIADVKRQAAASRNRRSLKELDATYRETVKHLNLHPRHIEWLKAQGLTEAQIKRFCYRSTPTDPEAVQKEVKRAGCSADGSLKDEKKIPSGILVPQRNSKGMFQGFELITDDGRVHSGDHLHFRRGDRGVKEAVILSSAFEADVVCALSGYTVLAVPENFSERLLECALKSLYDKGMRKARLSYDLWTASEACVTSRKRFALVAKECGLEVTMMKVASELPLYKYLQHNK